MCGICGVFNYGNSRQAFDEALLVRMSDTIKHRGPDDSGTFVSPDGRVGFGFRRLSKPTREKPGFGPQLIILTA